MIKPHTAQNQFIQTIRIHSTATKAQQHAATHKAAAPRYSSTKPPRFNTTRTHQHQIPSSQLPQHTGSESPTAPVHHKHTKSTQSKHWSSSLLRHPETIPVYLLARLQHPIGGGSDRARTPPSEPAPASTQPPP
ncbi:hypothetical protein ACOSP7_028293 [Xanthoceras sorbifolium]